MDQFMSASIIQFVSTDLTNRFEQISVSVRVLKRGDGSRHRRRNSLSRNGTRSVDPLELRQLEMQGWTTKVNSIAARLGSENEFDGVPSCPSVESSGESKVGLLERENGATLDWHNAVGAGELTAGCGCQRLDFAQVCTEAMRALGENKRKVRNGKRAEILKENRRHIESQGLNKCGLGGERFTSLGESNQASVRSRIGNVIHAFITVSVLSGLDIMRIEVEVQKVL
jgi:hypothetical protein